MITVRHRQEPGRSGMQYSWIAGLLAILCVFSMPLMAAADDGPTDEEEARMQGLLELRTANDAFDDEDFETAYEHYVKAFELLDEPMVKYRMGQSAEKIGKVTQAIEHYQAYRETGDDEEFLARIDEAMPRLFAEGPATVNITSDPEGAEIVVIGPGDRPGQAPMTIDVDAGEVHIALRMEGYREATFQKTLLPGESADWEASLEPREESEPDTLEMHPPVVEPAEEPDDGSRSILAWTSLGLGTGMLAFGGVMTFLQVDATNEVNDFDRSGVEATTRAERDDLRAEQAALRSDAETYHRAALSAYIAGGILAATGAGLLIYGGVRGDGSGDGGSVSLRGGFGPDRSGFVGVGGQF